MELCQTLYAICNSDNFNADIKFNAKTYLDGLLKFETILTAIVFQKIFSHTTPLSNYLQTAGMEILQSYRMVEKTLSSLKLLSRDFCTISKEASTFITSVNNHFSEKDIPLQVEEEFPVKRAIKRTKFYDEKNDTTIKDPIEKFKIEVFYMIMDRIVNSLEIRFTKHHELFKDFQCFHPSSFDCLEKLPEDFLNKVTEKINAFFPEIQENNLKQQLLDFASKWPRLSQTLSDEYSVDNLELDNNDLLQKDIINKHKACKKCLICCYTLLLKYNMCAEAYPDLQTVYQYILTLSISQVSCERSFSKLKYILNRLRNSLGQDHLEAFMLMAIEKDVLQSLDNNDIIKHLIENCKSLRQLLSHY